MSLINNLMHAVMQLLVRDMLETRLQFQTQEVHLETAHLKLGEGGQPETGNPP